MKTFTIRQWAMRMGRPVIPIAIVSLPIESGAIAWRHDLRNCAIMERMTALQVVRKFYPDVHAVKDATRALDIEVLPRDIKSSAVRNHKACAFAVACRRTKQVDGAVISLKIAYLIKNGEARRYSVPESVSREIVAFDRNGAFAAGNYRLLRPIRKLGTPSATGSNNRSGKGPKVEYRHATQAIRSMHDVG